MEDEIDNDWGRWETDANDVVGVYALRSEILDYLVLFDDEWLSLLFISFIRKSMKGVFYLRALKFGENLLVSI